MRTVALLLALSAAIATRSLGADEPAQPPPLPPPQEHTTVRGTMPQDIVGRWMALGWIQLPGGKARSTAFFWEVTREKDQLVLTNRFAGLPPAQQQAIDAANRSDQPWHPTPEDVRAIIAAWDKLPAIDPRLVQVDNELVGHDGFDESFTDEPRTKDALWVVRQSEAFDRSAAPSIKQVNIYAALESKDGGYAGNYTAATIAAAPFPIPITLNGTFELYRLEGAGAPRGFLARLLDLFSGCGCGRR